MRSSIAVRLLAASRSILLLCAGMMPAGAHHAFSAEYDIDRPVTLTGTLTKVEWVNPHSWLHVNVTDAAGTVVNWSIEFGGPNTLLRRGLRTSDLPIGTVVRIQGYRSRAEQHVANGITVTLPDGRDFFTGSSGTGAPTK